eukprot:CAMPEP_0179249888 /NCGR_PEP_ID=MMETSP0797-20121207/20879_1 /TAXON_ID=47934 /ORGANISM="Dinophysis acuminata, Strain DAEP01" /LENGTH=231 /DNA_ID=CAMNT_0020957597 /DNA_START=131 /DNA_END=823 /DNA_ORIENTATION=+
MQLSPTPRVTSEPIGTRERERARPASNRRRERPGHVRLLALAPLPLQRQLQRLEELLADQAGRGRHLALRAPREEAAIGEDELQPPPVHAEVLRELRPDEPEVLLPEGPRAQLRDDAPAHGGELERRVLVVPARGRAGLDGHHHGGLPEGLQCAVHDRELLQLQASHYGRLDGRLERAEVPVDGRGEELLLGEALEQDPGAPLAPALPGHRLPSADRGPPPRTWLKSSGLS